MKNKIKLKKARKKISRLKTELNSDTRSKNA